ncbi:S-layer homology domain-containing protein [Lysinibacillus varians]|uniref:S-layer homology domain-containing protein n=3 Tax=Bacillaceae TaxID=186817 RepID=A0ABY2T691_9BACI|nr:S-layer homology domain-containing protein [Lysinibacillus tabacifolii]TKI52392.1 S-layer homology domain-containing protein [Lysinibacillus varians]
MFYFFYNRNVVTKVANLSRRFLHMKQKYSKWVVGAASAALVASAIVPVASAASFSDIENSDHKDAILALADAKIVGGYTDGTFKPNAVVTRGNVTKFLGKWLVSEGYEVPADYATKARFTDLPTTAPDQELLQYAALVKDAGVFKGSNDQLMYTKNMSREQMAVVLVRAINTVYGVDLVADYKESDFKSTITDLDNATANENREAIIALEYAGLTNVKAFNPKNTLTRGQFASFLNRTITNIAEAPLTVKEAKVVDATTLEVTLSDDTKHTVKLETALPENKETKVDFEIEGKAYSAVVTYEVAEVKLESVKAVNAKTIEVKFNKAVEDTSKATIELLRGTFKQNVTLTWAADKKSVQLVGATNFQAADYTVNISGLTEKVLTSDVKIEAQKVTSIEILDEVAVVDTAIQSNGTFAAGTTATVGYVVKDQYGTDITKTTSLKTNDTANTTVVADAAKGVVKLSGAVVEGKKIGDLVPVVLFDTATGTSVSKTVKLSAESTVSSIEVAGVYNAKGEEVVLNDNSKASEAFIVLNLKDQYGKEITDAAKASGLVITNTNTTNLTIDNKVTKVKIGEKDKLVVALSSILKAGDTDVLLISTTNGQSAKYTVKVAETTTTNAISVSQPEIAVANEATLIPLTVTDKEGNVITNKKILADANKGIKVGGTPVAESALEVKDGQVYYKTTFGAAGTQALVFQTSTFKVATITVDVKAAAVPTVVRGLKNPLVISTAQAPVTITAKDHLIIEDQYGREMKNSAAPVTVTLVGTSDVVSVSANQVTPLKNGTATLNVALVTPNGTIDSAVEVKVQVTDGTEYKGYEIAEIGKTKVATDKKITVNGLLNGGKVALEPNEYTATVTGGKLTAPQAVTAGKVNIADTALNTDTTPAANKIDTEFTLKVTINATGEVLEQKFVVSADAEKTQDFFFTASTVSVDLADYNVAKAITEATLASGATVANLKTTGDAPVVVNVATVDQYGNKEIKALAAETVTIVPEKVTDVTIAGNGTAAATATLKAGVTEAKVTLKIKVGNATKELKATIVTP